jgi:ABC-type transport system, involved in lipoprotein release, permease component
MKFLMKKMIRDMKNMSRQFIAIFLMAFIAMLIYSGMEGTWFGMEKGVAEYFQNTNIANAWILSNHFSESDIEEIQDIKGIKLVEGRSVIDMNVLENTEQSSDVKVTVFSALATSTPLSLEGEKLNIEAEGIWIDKEYAKENSLLIGDKLNLSYDSQKISLTILGTILDSEYMYYLGNSDEVLPDYKQYGYAYMNENTYQKYIGQINVNKLYLEYEQNADEVSIKEKVYERNSTEGQIYLNQNQNQSIRGVYDKIQQMYKISIMFSAIFILLALLTIVTTMRRIINIQKIQIGTLKGLGFKESSIILHYALYGFLISLIATALGTLIGPKVLAPILIEAQLKTYTIPVVQGQLTYISVLMCIGIISSCTIAAIVACIKGMKGVPAENMRNGEMQSIKFKRNSMLNKVSFEWRWILREIVNNRVRFLMGIVGVAGCMMLIMATRGLQDSAYYANDYLYNEIYHYNDKMNVSPEFNHNNVSGNEYQFIQEGQLEIVKNDTEKIGIFVVLDKGNMITLYNESNKKIDMESNEGVISHKLAETLSVKKGDIVEVKSFLNENYIYLKITEIANIPSPQGIYMSKETWESLGMKFISTSVLSQTLSSTEKIKDELGVNRITKKEIQSQSVERLLDTFGMIFLLLNAAAITMGAVILYNLGTLSYTEKHREYATLKVLGYRRLEILSLAMKESLLTTFIGILVAIPGGYLFLKMYVQTVSIESFEWLIKLNQSSFLTALLITIICSVGINLLVAQKISKIKMVDALKSVE